MVLFIAASCLVLPCNSRLLSNALTAIEKDNQEGCSY